MRRRTGGLLLAALAGAVGTAAGDLGAGLLCAGATLALVETARQGRHGAGPAALPAAPEQPRGQVGHPLVSQLVTDFERADRDHTVLRRLDRRVAVALHLPATPTSRRAADLHRVLAGSEQR